MKLCKQYYPIRAINYSPQSIKTRSDVSMGYINKQAIPRNYFIGVAVPSDPSFIGIAEAIQQGFTAELASLATIQYYQVDGTVASITDAVNQFISESQSYTNKAFIASTTTTEFKTAMETLPSDVLVVSIASTASDISFAGENGLSMAYSDTIAANSLVLAMIYNRTPDLAPQRMYIIALADIPYANGYIRDITNALNIVPPRTITLSPANIYRYNDKTEISNYLSQISSTIQENDILVYIGTAGDLDMSNQSILRTLPTIYFYATDLADGIDFDYPNLKAYVATNSYMNYTNATMNLYKTLYAQNPSLQNYVSAYVPFSFDCARQLDFMIKNQLSLTTKNFSITETTGIYQKAALETNWINADLKRPEFGLSWLTQTSDPFWSEHIRDFNSMTLGSVHTLPRSAANGMRLGTASWVDKNGYLITIIWWDDVYNKDNQWIFTRLTTQGLNINTNLPYQSNLNRNNNIGEYLLQFDVAVAPAYVKGNQTDVKTIPGTSQFPLNVRTTRLLI